MGQLHKSIRDPGSFFLATQPSSAYSFHLWVQDSCLIISYYIYIPASREEGQYSSLGEYFLEVVFAISKFIPWSRTWSHGLTHLQKRLGNAVLILSAVFILKFRVLFRRSKERIGAGSLPQRDYFCLGSQGRLPE